MGGQGKWKARGERNKDKARWCKSQNTSYTHSSIPIPSLYPRLDRSYPVPSEIGEETVRHLYAIIRGLVSRVRNLERCVREVPKIEIPSHTCQCSDLKWREVNPIPRVRRLHALSEGKCRSCYRPLNFIPSCSRQQEIKKNLITIGIQTESPYLSRTIDVTQCRYCTS
jgi:hypothetical protein